MNIRHTFALSVLSLAAASTGVFAQTAAPAAPAAAANPAATPGIDARQARQEQRIDQGVASGQLTKRETRRLDREQGAINRVENKAKADGIVTAQERKRLHHMQNHAGKDISRQKHDAQKRMPPSGPGTGPSMSPGG